MNKKNNLNDSKENNLDYVEVIVTLNETTYHIQWNKSIPLLDAMLNAKINAPYSCCSGKCGTCVCKLEEGNVRLKRNFVLSEKYLQQGLILTCVAAPISEKITINYDEF